MFFVGVQQFNGGMEPSFRLPKPVRNQTAVPKVVWTIREKLKANKKSS